VTVVIVEAAPKHPILPDSSGVPNGLYLHPQRGLPVRIRRRVVRVLIYARHDLGKMPLVCGVFRGMRRLPPGRWTLMIIAMKILISLIPFVSIVLARSGY
jgi:hypothetical protein